jgi:hypothetical protein
VLVQEVLDFIEAVPVDEKYISLWEEKQRALIGKIQKKL